MVKYVCMKCRTDKIKWYFYILLLTFDLDFCVSGKGVLGSAKTSVAKKSNGGGEERWHISDGWEGGC